MGNNVKQDIEWGITAQRALNAFELNENPDIIQINDSPEEERKFYDDERICKSGNYKNETKHDQKSTVYKNIFVEDLCDDKPSGIAITQSKTWSHIFYHDKTAYCVRYEVEYLKKRCEEFPKSSKKRSQGFLIPKEEVLKDIEHKRADKIFEMPIKQWVQMMRAQGNIDERWIREMILDQILEMERGPMQTIQIAGITINFVGDFLETIDANGNKMSLSSAPALTKPTPAPYAAVPARKPAAKKSSTPSPAKAYIVSNHGNGTEFTKQEVMSATGCTEAEYHGALGRISREKQYKVESSGDGADRKHRLTKI